MPVITPENSPPLHQVRELPAGERVTGFYLLVKSDLKPKRTGGQYLELTLQDATAKISAKMWEGFEDFYTAAAAGNAVKVEGAADRFQGSFSLILSRIRLATAEEVPDPRIFLPHSALSRDEATVRLGVCIASLQNESLRALLMAIFDDTGFLDRYLEVPAGKMWHHAELGGLAEHSLHLVQIADGLSPVFTGLNRDLLVAGALLHDIGKVFELTADTIIDYSIDGRLLGHIYMGAAFIEAKMREIEGFPEEIRRQVLHLVLSHQGDGTMGSPVKPMTEEALVLHYLDEMDSKLNAFARIRRATPAGQDFSDYVKLMDRFFYLNPIDTSRQGEGQS
jgi:3'-5' exoribonuclease